jgi:hypothetical protein
MEIEFYASFEAFMAAIHVEYFWVVVPCSVV